MPLLRLCMARLEQSRSTPQDMLLPPQEQLALPAHQQTAGAGELRGGFGGLLQGIHRRRASGTRFGGGDGQHGCATSASQDKRDENQEP